MDHFDTNRLTPLKITLNLPKANTDLEIKVLSHSVLTSLTVWAFSIAIR